MARKRTGAQARRGSTSGQEGAHGRGARARGRSPNTDSTRNGSDPRGSGSRKKAASGSGTGGARKTGAGSSSRTRRGDREPRAGGALLSRSTLRAKWIDSPDAHEDYSGQTLATRNHDVIRRWAAARGAIPATVPGTEHDGHLGVLTFDFPGYGGERLQHVTWDEWFRTFDERNLVFVFQEHLKMGRPSTHFILDSPEREAA